MLVAAMRTHTLDYATIGNRYFFWPPVSSTELRDKHTKWQPAPPRLFPQGFRYRVGQPDQSGVEIPFSVTH